MFQTLSFKEHHLSFLDQQPHIRNYGRTLFIFPFLDLHEAEAATQALRYGFAALLRRFPYLTGTLTVPDRTTDRLKLLYPEHFDVEEAAARLFTSSLELATNSRFRYEVLGKDGFDPSGWPSDIFCPSTMKHHPGLEDSDHFANQATNFDNGIPLPAMAGQVTFIPGGLVLSVWTHHCIADGAGARQIYTVWSESVRNLARLSEPEEFGKSMEPIVGNADIDLSAVPHALDDLAHASTPEPQTPIPNRHHNPLRTTTYKVVAKLLRFHPATITRLRHSLTHNTNTNLTGFVTIATLLWTHILRAQRSALASASCPSSTLAVVVDLRSRLQAPFNTTPEYLGNCVLNAKPTCSLPSAIETFDPTRKLSVYDIAPFALSIHNSIKTFDREAVTSRLATLIASTTTPPVIDCQELAVANGPALYITSWLHVGADLEWGIPGTGTSKPTAIRRAAWKGEGGIVVLPRLKGNEACWEVQVGLEEGDMRGLEEGLRGGGWLVGTEGEDVDGEWGKAKL